MAAPHIARRARFTPPPYAKVDWSHPLASGLVVFAVPLVGTRTYINLVDGERKTATALYRVNVPTPTTYGLAATGDLDAQDPLPAFSASKTSASLMAMVALRLNLGGTDTGSAGKILLLGTANAAGQYHEVIRNTNASPNSQIRVSNWGNDVAAWNVSTGEDHVVVTGLGPGGNYAWMDGTQVGSASGTTWTDPVVIRQTLLPNAAYSCLAVWARAASARDAAALYADPYQMLRW